LRTVHCRASNDSREVKGLADQVCNEFVCTSSPELEPTVRTLARDIEAAVDGRRTPRCYAEKVTYKDPFRSFEGRDKYDRMKHISETIGNPAAMITSVELKTTDTLVITYTLKGDTPAGSLDMDFTETYKLNVISGRVVEHEVTWESGRTSPAAAAFFAASRAAYSSGQGLEDTQESVNSTLDELFAPPNKDIQGDPADPMKFFQQEDSTMNDMFIFAAGATMIYAVVQILTL